jgi:hypothetical protein
MADPQTALATQLRNIESKTGKTLAQLREVIARSGLAKHGEVRSMLMERFGLGYGDANALAHAAKAEPAPAGDQALDVIYSGAKAGLRPLHDPLLQTGYEGTDPGGDAVRGAEDDLAASAPGHPPSFQPVGQAAQIVIHWINMRP